MRSAVFVDFDNVFSQLRQLQPDAAERFARRPSEWIGWLTKSLPLPEPAAEGDVRRLLFRRCYLNPNWYQSYRHAFLRAGFEIVDCPPVTSQGKTSTALAEEHPSDLANHGHGDHSSLPAAQKSSRVG